MKTYSTKQAAKRAGISWRTLVRWVAARKVRPSQVAKLDGITVWLWTPAGVEQLRRYKAAHYNEGHGGDRRSRKWRKTHGNRSRDPHRN